MSTSLPRPGGALHITEAGLETELVFIDGIDLPDFASFPLLEDADGRARLRNYYERFVEIARRDRRGIVFETPTWRASADWGVRLGFSAADLDRINQDAVALLREVAADNIDVDIVVSANLGPRGDGYVVSSVMTANEAALYHGPQIRSFAAAGADTVTVLTMTYAAEAAGVAMAATEADMPVVVSFTVETDGRLPSGESLAEAIDEVDRLSDSAPAYFMVNCAHPTHMLPIFEQTGPWQRIGGVRANASTMSHAELDEATELDRGDIGVLADGFCALREALPNLVVVGGCCGTDREHVAAISAALAAVDA